MSGACTDCGGPLEHSPELGTTACTVCGLVSTSSSSQAIEFLGRVHDEDAFEGGRTIVGSRQSGWGGTGAEGARRMGGKATAWMSRAGESAVIYHSKKHDDFQRYLNRLLTRFNVHSLRRRVQWLFDEAKRKVRFKWGKAAETFGAACLYIAAREANKGVWLLELAEVVEVKDLYTLTRAVRIVKYETGSKPMEIEPAMFIERILAHLNTVFATSNAPPPLHNSSTAKKTTWSASNLAWIRALSLPEVRTLAAGLLSFSTEQALTAGRAPEPVACAVVLVALEGVARRPCPVQQEFCDELAWLLGTKAYTIQERYRDFNRLLADRGRELPWLIGAEFSLPGEKGKADKKRKDGKPSKKGMKKELVQFTSDIVQFWRAIDARRAKERGVKAEKEAARLDKGKGKGKAVEQDEDDPGIGEQGADYPPGGDSDDEDDAGDGDDAFADPLLSLKASNAFLEPTPQPNTTLSPEQPRQPDPPWDHNALPKQKFKRPAEFQRASDPSKRLKQIEDAAGSIVAAGRFALSPSPADTPSPSFPSSSALPPSSAQPAHAPNTVLARQLLLAGNDPALIWSHLHARKNHKTLESQSVTTTPTPATRLDRLLWDKPVDAVADDELFDADELESYVRSEPEVAAFLRLPATQDMLRIDAELSAARAAQPPRANPRRRTRSRFFAKGYENDDAPENAVPEPAGLPRMNGAGAARATREGTGESDSFRPRKKKTKLKPEAKARIEALLALERGAGSDEDEDGGDGAGEWRFDLALDAARDEGEEVADDDGDAASDVASPARGRGGEDDEEDWRAALGYGAGGDEEEEGYDD
ncbi:hypothetical protein JCM10207_007352 [Rhodosporidiobolus poonsookiae]